MGKEVFTKIRVRYSETDKMGIVHHSRYYPWFEIARCDFLRECGLSYRELEEEGLMIPLIESGAKYKQGLCFDDEIMVLCRLKSLGVVRCTFEYEVIRLSDNVVTTTGITSHAFCDETLKPINLKKKFPKYYEILLNCINDTKE